MEFVMTFVILGSTLNVKALIPGSTLNVKALERQYKKVCKIQKIITELSKIRNAKLVFQNTIEYHWTTQ